MKKTKSPHKLGIVFDSSEGSMLTLIVYVKLELVNASIQLHFSQIYM